MIIKEKNSSPLKALAADFKRGDKPKLISSTVRIEIGPQFVAAAEQDAPDFLTSLLLKHTELCTAITHTHRLHTKCNNCSYVNIQYEENLIKVLPVKPSTQAVLINIE